jgi:hypothetical protein
VGIKVHRAGYGLLISGWRRAMIETIEDFNPAGGAARNAAAKTGKRDPCPHGGLEYGLTRFGFNVFVFRQNVNFGHIQRFSPTSFYF